MQEEWGSISFLNGDITRIHTQQVHVFFRIKRKLAGLNIKKKKSTWLKNTPIMLSKIRTDFKVGLGVRYWGEPPDVMV